MTASAEVSAVPPFQLERSPGSLIFRVSAGKAVRSGLAWGAVYGIMVASAALSYVSIYPHQAQRDQLELLFGSNHAASALFGPGNQLQTVAGFTVYKVSMTLMILGAIWGILLSTRLLRGEEDAGRMELLVAGQTTRPRATAQVLVALGLAVSALWAVTALVTVVTGRSSSVVFRVGPSLFFAVALSASALMFLAVGAVTSQMAATRRQASTYGAIVLGVSYAIRMLADSGAGLDWLRWLSPLGWVEILQPFTDPQPLALLCIAGFTIGLSILAVHLTGLRDLGSSTFRDRSHARAKLGLLRRPLGLSARLLRPSIIGWIVAVVLSALLVGFVAKAAGQVIRGSSVEQILARLGATSSGANSYLGMAFLILAVLVAFVAANQVTAVRGEESGGRLDALIARPVSRVSWLGGRTALGASVVVAAGLLAGLFAWLGVLSQSGGVSLGPLMKAGVNIVPPGLCVLGLGIAVFGLFPRLTTKAVYGYVAWSLLIEIVGGIGAVNHVILDTSVFHHMAPAPAVSPNWTAGMVMAAIGCAGAGAGLFAFRSRDLKSE